MHKQEAARLLDSLRESMHLLTYHVSKAYQGTDNAGDPPHGRLSPAGFGHTNRDGAPIGIGVCAADGFRWESDAGGMICWVDGLPRAAVVGRSLAELGLGDVVRSRQMFGDAQVTFADEGIAAGGWRMSGTPVFDDVSGRFQGYRGVACRDMPVECHSGLETLPPDMVRQFVHELRTPLNAIIGFADMIDGQHLGPAEPAHRARAAAIADEATKILRAVEQLDRHARGE